MRSHAKLTTLDTLVEKLTGLRAQGKSIALANGAFDMLHVGHVRYLRGAVETADVLVVAINSDSSVKRLKGEQRPIFPESERAELVASLEVVDFVLIFEEDDVSEVIRHLKPEVHVKGTDYTPETVPERDLVLAYGGRVAVAGDPKDHSTTDIISQLEKKS